MKNYFLTILFGILLLVACTPTTTSTPVAILPTDIPTDIPTQIPTPIPSDTPTSTPTPLPQGNTIIVTSTSDSGPGSLRQALQDAQPYDTITFDPTIFPPNAPATIAVMTELPFIQVSNLTLDASQAGVILDGSQIPGDWVAGLQIVSSQANTIMGLQISHFPGPGIAISGDSKHNVIGGDRSLGAGPFGQGNLFSHNAVGIDLASNRTTLNTITGNLIGTDTTGANGLGNLRSGIMIWEGAHGNTIGPDNLIAYNGGAGVEVDRSDTLHNTITQNSIHDNNGRGIDLSEGGNAILHAPMILDFDLPAGTAKGATCSNCTVEIFSDKDEGGANIEGWTTADDNGVFSFNKGASFTGPHLTATTTDVNGNTSEFSRPVGFFDTYDVMSQEDNPFPRFLLSPRPSQELLDNHIGVHFEDYIRYSDTEHVYMNGFKWIRIQSLTDFWGDGNEYLTFSLESIPDEVDAIISEYTANGVNIVLDLWMGAGLEPYGTTFQSEQEINRYLEYVRFVVSHFKGRIHYYQIWNEPGDVAVSDYANLVREVVPVIREEDPGARIIIGGMHGHWENGYPGYGDYQRFSLDLDYLNELLLSGVAPMVDGVSFHPFYSNIPSDPYYQNYPQMLQGIKDLAASQGFTGEYFADELLWRTRTEVDWPGGPPVRPFIAAKYYARAITMHRGLAVNVTINTGFQKSALAPIHNLCDILAGAEPTDITLSLEPIEGAHVRYYAFALPNGDKLVALWTNDEAVEEDYGASATLTMSSLEVERYIGFSPQSVIGIDVLYGFEQELITETENGNLIVRDLLIKDYPIILRLIR